VLVPVLESSSGQKCAFMGLTFWSGRQTKEQRHTDLNLMLVMSLLYTKQQLSHGLGLQDTLPLLEIVETPQELWFGCIIPIDIYCTKKTKDSCKNNGNKSTF